MNDYLPVVKDNNRLRVQVCWRYSKPAKHDNWKSPAAHGGTVAGSKPPRSLPSTKQAAERMNPFHSCIACRKKATGVKV